MAGESAPEFMEHIFSAITPDQLITCGGRNLDPQEFSLTPLAEPNGMTKETLLRVIRSIAKAGDVVGFGLLEYSGTKSDKGDPFLKDLTAFGLSSLEGVLRRNDQ